ncbi:MAG: hypothetical protein JWQ18_3931 [Conexibacter sp.]|nr:hypothetical protein [Conexibacter sp.]
MKLSKFLRGAPATREADQPRRRRRAVRPDGPKTIVPVDDAPPLARDLDAARERLRRSIPPVADED